MNGFERSKELIGIMILGWITMLIALIAIDRIIVPITIPKPNYLFAVLEGIIKLLGAGIIALIWLFTWKTLVKYYKLKMTRKTKL